MVEGRSEEEAISRLINLLLLTSTVMEMFRVLHLPHVERLVELTLVGQHFMEASSAKLPIFLVAAVVVAFWPMDHSYVFLFPVCGA